MATARAERTRRRRMFISTRRYGDATHVAAGIDTWGVHVGDVHRRQGEAAGRHRAHHVGDVEGVGIVLVVVPPRAIETLTEIEGREETIVARLADAGRR